jgi:CBS domain-containing protein
MAEAVERGALRELSEADHVAAGDVMRPALTAVEPNDHLAAAAYLMQHAGETALVVVDNEQARRPVGLVTETGIVQIVADGKDPGNIRIHTLMSRHPTVVRTSATVSDAARAMVAGHFRHLPVVGDRGQLLGIVDILNICAALLEIPARP